MLIASGIPHGIAVEFVVMMRAMYQLVLDGIVDVRTML